MARRSIAEIAAAAAAAERAAAVAFIHAKRADVQRMVEKNRISAAEGTQLSRWLAAIADGLEHQLHL